MKSILLIDQDQQTACELCIRLKSHGYATWIANDAIGGLSLAASQKPAIIVLDSTLVAGNAFHLAKRLKELPPTRKIPIILTTAITRFDLRKQVMDLGFASFIQKPYDAAALLAEIRLLLPKDPHPGPLPSDGRGESPQASSGKFFLQAVERARKTVLIVEDDERVAMALALRIRAAGFDTTIAVDGFAGVRNAVLARPDAIVLDISLPAGDGFTVAQRIHAAIPTPVPIIFLTASKRQDFRHRAAQLGAVGFFEKPYLPEALLAAIQQATA